MAKTKDDRWKAYKRFEKALWKGLNDSNWGLIEWYGGDKADFKEELRTAWEEAFPEE